MTSARSIGSLFSFEAFYDFSTNVLHLFKLQLLFDKSVVSSLTLHTRKTVLDGASASGGKASILQMRTLIARGHGAGRGIPVCWLLAWYSLLQRAAL